MATKDPFDLSGRVALVTGASSHGIGSESAKVLAAHGAKVFITARREENLAHIAQQIEDEGGTAAYLAADVSSEEDCKRSVEACLEAFGRLDIMVLSAGISGRSAGNTAGGTIDPEAVFDTENWNKVVGINLEGVFWMIKYGWEECAKNGVGAIIPISSLAAWKAEGNAAYTATKGALRSLTPWLGKNLGPYGVRVNSFYPGVIDTDMTHPALNYEPFIKPVLEKTPLGRTGTVEDCANAILFLASDASSFMTGQHLIADGGVLC